MQSVAEALFAMIGSRFGIFTRVRSSDVNAADASTGNVADLECVDDEGRIIIAVEVKDRQLTLRQIQDKLPSVREKGVRELLFVVQGGVIDQDTDDVRKTIEQQFITGQNLYVTEWTVFLSSCLVQFGELGRREFLSSIGTVLDKYNADIIHRRKWAELLGAI
jgi:hypothetical protein